MLNLTICALSASFFSISPIISPSSYSTVFTKTFYKQIYLQKSFTSFHFDHSNIASSLFFHSSFLNFLSTPINVEKEELKLVNKKYESQQILDNPNLTIIGCTFINCNTNSDKRGGAIRCICSSSGSVTVYSSTFENCKAENGDGGAIFVCGMERNTDFESTHEFAKAFNSKYCCYSKCSATGSEQYEGYGPVMFVFANFIGIIYSTATECPAEGQSYGAQIDLKSREIESSYINSTKGTSIYCCAIEYREANQGHFTYQTYVDLSGCFLSSFSQLKSEDINISYCNYVNDSITAISEKSGSIFYVNNCNVHIAQFCFVGIKIVGDFKFVFFEKKQEIHKINFINSYIENSFKDQLNNEDIITDGIVFYDDNNIEKFTNPIDLLGLGPCKGEMKPPPTIFSPTFTATSAFSSSQQFSMSKQFSESNKFSQSANFVIITNSNKFSESNIFSKTQMFTLSHFFSQTELHEIIDRDSNLQNNDNKKGFPKGAIAGIAAAAAAVVLAVVAFFIIRARRKVYMSSDIILNDSETPSIKTANPIYGEGPDDPFKDDF